MLWVVVWNLQTRQRFMILKWVSLPIPSSEFLNDGFCRDCAVVDGKIYGMCYVGLGFVFYPILSTIKIVSSGDPVERSHCHGIQVLFSTWKK